MVRRRPGQLLPLEVRILEAAIAARRRGDEEFHGFGIAHVLRDEEGASKLIGHGTLYKALGRLEEMGLLESRWEDPELAEGRPPRRLYQVTGVAERAVSRARQGEERHLPRAFGVEPT